MPSFRTNALHALDIAEVVRSNRFPYGRSQIVEQTLPLDVFRVAGCGKGGRTGVPDAVFVGRGRGNALVLGNVAQVFRHPGRTVAELPDAILDACVLQQVGIFRQVVFDRSDRSSVLPAFDGAADGGVDLIRVADYRLDRIFRTGLQVGRLECFGVPVAVGSLDFEFECRPLRYENGFISSCGHRWKGIDIRFRRRSIDLNAFRRKIDGRRAAAALQGDFLDRIGGVVRNIDHDFGEQVGEYHIHGRLARYDVRRRRCQQVRGFVIGGELLVGTNGEARRSSFRQVGIVSREIRFFTRIVVPEQVVRNEDRTVETQRRIFTVVSTGFDDREPDAVPGVEIEPRNTGDARSDSDAGLYGAFDRVVLAAASCQQCEAG